MSHLHHKISALIDGELHGAARRRALQHVRACADCRHELKAMLALKSRMSGLATGDPSADLVSVLSGVAAHGRTGPVCSAPSLRSVRSRLAPVMRRLVVGAGSMSVAVLSLAYVVGAPSEAAAPAVAPPVDEYAADFAGNTGLAPLSDPALGAMDGDLEPVALVTSNGSTTVSARTAVTRSVGDDSEAVTDLERAVAAPSRFAYAGVRELQSYDAGDISTMRVEVHHSPGQGTSFGFEGDDSYAGATFLPESGAGPHSELDGAPLDLLIQTYDLAIVGPSVLLGRPVTVIAASRRGVLDARFWVDDATGLLVRRELYDDGALVRSSGFTSLTVSRDGFLPHFPPELEAPGATPVSMTSAAALNDDGWTCPGKLWGDFVLTDLEHVDTAGDVMRATYTDGLSTISLFEQRGALDSAAVSDLSKTSVNGSTVYVGYGLPTVAVWASGETVYTVVTDATHDVTNAALAGLPHEPRQTVGVGDRLWAGLGRMGSFLTPAI